jgi:putative spermidine/putrescine transport system substrate-binding protein
MKTNGSLEIGRRGLLAGAGALAGAAAMGGPRMAWAQRRTAVVGTWGGDYQNLLDANIVRPLLAPQNVEVQYDVANAPPRKNKLLAERRLPRGTLDIACLSDIDMYEMSLTGVLEDLDTSKFPNSLNLIPALSKRYAAPHIYSGLVIVYNPQHAEPKSWADLWDSRYAGRIGFADGLYVQHIKAAAFTAGGGRSDFEPGKAKLMELKRTGAKVYPSNEAVAQALQTGEIWITPMWRARAFQWANAGIPVKDVAPSEGVVPILFEMAVPKNSQNKDAAYAFLNAMLDPRAQAGFAEKMGYVPTVTNAPLPANLETALSFTAAEQQNFVVPDYEYIAANNNSLREWWQREFLG